MKTQLHAAMAAASMLALGACTSMMPMNDAERATTTTPFSGEQSVTVGGAAMYPSRNIIQNAMNSRDHTTLVAAVQSAGLVETLSGPGPFTVFAPTNAAFDRLPAGTVETLVMPANRAALTRILTYHVVSGRLSAADIMQRIQAGGGTARLTTVQGGVLTASMMGNRIMLTDAMGGVSHVTIGDVFQSNGVIHVTDAVSMPG